MRRTLEPSRLFRTTRGFAVALCSALSLVTWSNDAAADRLTIKEPRNRVSYAFEAEPHVLLTPFEGPWGDGGAFGAGFRGTIELVENGFVSTINNSIGLGFGADLLFRDEARILVPVVMQWNFWLSENWSVFGEPGGVLILGDKFGARPMIHAGGRWHFSDTMSLTMRLGYPSLSVGLSIFL